MYLLINDILSFDWDFNNDGVYDDFTGNSGQWSFAKDGLHTIGVRVSDGDGGFAEGSLDVKVERVPEHSSVLSVLAFGAFGAGFLRKRQQQA